MKKFITITTILLGPSFIIFMCGISFTWNFGATTSAQSIYAGENGVIFNCNNNNAMFFGLDTSAGTYYATRPTVTDYAMLKTFASPKIAFAVNSNNFLTLNSDGTVLGWGSNADGQLGNGTKSNSQLHQVNGLTNITAIDLGQHHSLFLKNDGTVWASGSNGFGAFGDGTTSLISTNPVRANGLTGITDISAGYYYSLYLKNDSTVWACGTNDYGQLGIGSNTSTNAPIQVSGLTKVIAISAGYRFSLFLKSDSTVWACGQNGYGQFGNGTTTDSNIPVQVSGVNGIIAIAAGDMYSLFLKSDSTVWACGYNYFGQLGDGTNADKSIPVKVGITGVTAIDAGGGTSVFLKNDGTFWACGNNEHKYLGDGTTVNKNTPVQSLITTMTSASSQTICSGNSLHIPLTSNIQSDYTWVTADNINTTGESTTVQTTKIINDVIVNSSSALQILTYSVTSSNCFSGYSQIVTVSVNPKPIVDFTGLQSSYCYNASPQTLASLPSTGGTFSGRGVSGNVFTPSVAGSGIDTISYTYANSYNCTSSITKTTEILSIPMTPTICMVTADNDSKYNNIFWNKTPYTNVDSFIIYRETVSNTYKRIGAVAKDSLSMFIDTVRHLYFPFTGDPNSGTYRYKLQILDTCGNSSALSNYHNTIYVNQTGGTFTWNDYQIEGEATPIPELISYYLYRDNNSNGNWGVVSAVSGSQLTINDPDYLLYPNASYHIETQWNINCTPSRSFNTARSNVTYRIATKIETSKESAKKFTIFPNPNNGMFTLLLSQGKPCQIIISNALGYQIYSEQTNSEKVNIDLNTVSNGVYLIKVISEQNITTEKLILNK